MPKYRAGLDNVFHALADPTRRGVVERLSAGATTTMELARPFDLSLPSFTQHLGVLADAGVVRSTKTGRVRTYALVPDALDPADNWLAEQRRQWEQRLDRLDEFVRNLKEHDR